MSRDHSKPARDTRDIESDLANTRTRIDYTLELLEDRFRPSAIIDQAWRYARSKNEDGTTTRLQETIVRNPLPVVLMGVGVAWLLLSGRDGSVPRRESPLSEGARGDAASESAATSSQASSAVDKSDAARPASTGRASTHTHSSEPDPDRRSRRDEQATSAAFSDAASSGPTRTAPAQGRHDVRRTGYGEQADPHDRSNE